MAEGFTGHLLLKGTAHIICILLIQDFTCGEVTITTTVHMVIQSAASKNNFVQRVNMLLRSRSILTCVMSNFIMLNVEEIRKFRYEKISDGYSCACYNNICDDYIIQVP